MFIIMAKTRADISNLAMYFLNNNIYLNNKPEIKVSKIMIIIKIQKKKKNLSSFINMKTNLNIFR